MAAVFSQTALIGIGAETRSAAHAKKLRCSPWSSIDLRAAVLIRPPDGVSSSSENALCEALTMTLREAIVLFRHLGIDVRALERHEFDAAYYRLARRCRPDISPSTRELMANINAARAAILKSYRPD
jgi:hypothetical protein